MPQRIARLVLTLVVTVSPCLVAAQPGSGNASAPAANVSPWRIGAAFGYGERTNPLVQSDDIPILVDLDIAWFGDRWYFDNGDAGLTFADNEALTASVVGRINSERVFFSRTNTRFIAIDTAGAPLEIPSDFKPPERDYAVELGVELLSDGRWGALQLSGYRDASGTHDGFEISADYSFGWRRQRVLLEPSVGISYKSKNLNNYYWGLTAEEGRSVLPAYDAGAGVNWNLRLAFAYQLNRNWAVSVVAEYERLNDDAASSPIAEENDVKGLFAGLAWRF